MGLAIRLFRIDHHSFWYDEYATFSICAQSWSTLFGPLMRLETNPPGYYVVQKAWLMFGDSRAAMRLLPAIAGALVTPVLFLITRRLAGRPEAWIAALLFLTAPLHVEYARELRGYSLLTLAALVGVLATLKLLENGDAARATMDSPDVCRRQTSDCRCAVVLAASISFGLFLHNTAVFIPVILGGFVLLDACPKSAPPRWRRRLTILGVITAGCVPFLVWLPTMYAQATSEAGAPIHWIPELSVFHVYSTLIRTYPYPQLFKPAIYLVAAAGCILAFRRSRRLGLLTAMCLLGQPFMTLMASLVVPIFVRKVLLWPSALIFIPIALVIVQLRPVGRVAAVLLIIAMQLVAMRPEYPRVRIPDAYGDAAAFITESADGSHAPALVCFPPDIALRLQYAAREFPIPRERWLTVAPRGSAVKAIDPLLPGTGIEWNDLESQLASHESAWILVDAPATSTIPTDDRLESEFDALRATGWTIEQRTTTPDADVWFAQRRPQ